MRTCEELRKLNFHSIRMVEVRLRPMEARHVTLENAYVGRPSTATTSRATPALSSSCDSSGSAHQVDTTDTPTEATDDDMLIAEESHTHTHTNNNTTTYHHNGFEAIAPILTLDAADSSSSSSATANDNSNTTTNNNNNNNKNNSGRKAKVGAKPHFRPEVMPPTHAKYARYSNTMQGHTVSYNNSILIVYCHYNFIMHRYSSM